MVGAVLQGWGVGLGQTPTWEIRNQMCYRIAAQRADLDTRVAASLVGCNTARTDAAGRLEPATLSPHAPDGAWQRAAPRALRSAELDALGPAFSGR